MFGKPLHRATPSAHPVGAHSPCIFIKLNNVFGFFPQAMRESKLREETDLMKLGGYQPTEHYVQWKRYSILDTLLDSNVKKLHGQGPRNWLGRTNV